MSFLLAFILLSLAVYALRYSQRRSTVKLRAASRATR